MTRQVTLEDLPQFAVDFWKEYDGAKVFAFHAPMGGGKTTTILALCKAKGITETPSSPTFSIINEYAYPEGDATRKLYHIDLYRLKDLEEIIHAGVEDCLYSGDICFVEWPEKAPELFDEEAVHVYIEAMDERRRVVRVKE